MMAIGHQFAESLGPVGDFRGNAVGVKVLCVFQREAAFQVSMRALFSGLALLNIMRVMVASAALATVGQCKGSSGCAHGSELKLD